MKKLRLSFAILGSLAFGFPGGLRAQAPAPVVHAVLFYHPSCPHCHELITRHLIPMQNQYGDRLRILGMDTSQPWANNLYYEAIRYYRLPEEDWVVPILVVGQEVPIGGAEIPERLPGIIEAGLASGGIDLPDFPALVTFLREQDLLDPRYPDRLIARPAGPAPQTETPSAEAVRAEEDSIEAGDTASVLVSASADVPFDSVITPVEIPTPVEKPAEVVDSPAAGVGNREPPGNEANVASSDTGRVGQGPAGEQTDSAGPETRGSESPRPPVPEAPARPDSGVGSVGTLGLQEAASELESMTMWDRFNADRAGNSVSVLVLLGMLLTVALRGFPPRVRGREWPSWVVPVLVVVGAGVASYLSYVEVTHAEAVCGPVGDCNTVNQSEYARLLGVLPVGVLGLLGYCVILALWLVRTVGPEKWWKAASLGLWAVALFGTLFSIYLTFLEPFVIGATCAWCLTSAGVMTLLLWAASPGAARAWPLPPSTAEGG